MLNKDTKLNQQIFENEIEQAPIRKGFGEGLLLAGEKDSRIVGLCADLLESTQMFSFAKKFPERYFEMGIGEQSMASVASGLSAMGKIPFLTSYAMFSPGRNWEQIRTTICYNDQNVKIVGSHAGVSVGPDGGTHQAIEDLAIMRVIPRMIVIAPCDVVEAKKATLALANTKGPAYLRLAREKTPVLTTEETPFEIGRGQIFFQNENNREKKVALIACGALVHQAILAGQELSEMGFSVAVANFSTIKPLDQELLLKLAADYQKIVSIEEHQIAGGLGSAVAECLAVHLPTKMRFVGVKDQFGQSGKPEELLAHYEMDKNSILKAAQSF